MPDLPQPESGLVQFNRAIEECLQSHPGRASQLLFDEWRMIRPENHDEFVSALIGQLIATTGLVAALRANRDRENRS